MPKFKTRDDLDVAGKTVLVRVDFNVPMSGGKVTDATRLERAAPTVQDLTRKGARVLLLSHFGRPKGKPNLEMSLKPLAAAFGKVRGRERPEGRRAGKEVARQCRHRGLPHITKKK